jgi:hypothetical protein
MLHWIEPILGFALILLALADVFLTVLYARIGTGIISHRLACATWRLFKTVTKPVPRRRDYLLSLSGPVLVVTTILMWIFMLMTGAALVTHPYLGRSVTATNGSTPTDFVAALYVAGDSVTTVGTGEIAPRTAAFRLFFTCMSLLGICLITMTVTYLLEIYNALQRRNSLSLRVHLATDETGDAAELLAGLGPQGEFQNGYQCLVTLADEVAAFKESHHFYSVIVYFRFREPHYAIARLATVMLDTVTLIKSALDDQRYAWLKESSAVAQLWRASMHLMRLLSVYFLPAGAPDDEPEPPPELLEQWRKRYFAAVARLREAKIETMPDEQAGAEVYCSLRARWDRYVRGFAVHMAHDFATMDPAGSRPERVEERQPFETKLRAAG